MHSSGPPAPSPIAPVRALRLAATSRARFLQLVPSGPVLAGTCGYGDTATVAFPGWNVASANPANPVARCGACVEMKCTARVGLPALSCTLVLRAVTRRALQQVAQEQVPMYSGP